MLADGRRITTGTVAAHAGVSAPSARIALMEMVKAGKLEHAGAGRGAHFVPVRPALAHMDFSREGLDEDEVWSKAAALPAVTKLPSNVRGILHHAFTKMVNNAIDHSHGSRVGVTFFRDDGRLIGFEVTDDGVGVFENVMEKLRLGSPFEAIAELQKGKVTSAPEFHSGEGIFFTSKMSDHMSIESRSTRWLIDNTQPDNMAVTLVDPATRGTRVRFDIDVGSTRTAEGAFRPFTDEDHAWTKTRAVIRLFREASRIVSRSEAKRLLHGLEKWREVELDFRGIEGIGQGFADEVFRVWASAHPETRLLPTNANAAVTFMIQRAIATATHAAKTDEVGTPERSGTAFAVVGASTTTTTSGPELSPPAVPTREGDA